MFIEIEILSKNHNLQKWLKKFVRSRRYSVLTKHLLYSSQVTTRWIQQTFHQLMITNRLGRRKYGTPKTDQFDKLLLDNFASYRNKIIIITLTESGILTRHIEIKDSPDSKLQINYICSIQTLNILEVIAKLRISRLRLSPIDHKNRRPFCLSKAPPTRLLTITQFGLELW